MAGENLRSNRNSCVITIFVVVALASMVALFFIFKKVLGTEKELISLTFLPLLLGIFFELKRLRISYQDIIIQIVFALFISLIIAFLPDRRDNPYNIENHIGIFPFVFVAIFLIVSIIYFIENKKRKHLTSKLTEGIIFVQSLSILYLILDLLNFKNPAFLEILLLVVGIGFSSISIFHAFSKMKHGSNSKMVLSLWSSMIMLFFGFFYIKSVFQYEISVQYSFGNNTISFIQYFLFGTSAIYMLRNLYFIFGFLPSKGEYSADYEKRKNELTKIHIDRFSDQQLPILTSLFCLILVGGIYFLNYKYDWIPCFTMIWLVFTFFPFLIYMWENFILKKKENSI